MKKNIIIAAIAAASALLLSVSCQKENQPESQNGINGGANTFTATIEQSLTKTTLIDGVKVNWTSADKISINGKIYTASPKDDDATKADFTADDGEATAVDGKFKAIYPSTLYATDHFALPATQTYSAGAFNAPMYAESETQTLTFKNICAVLAIKVTSEDIATLKSIKVKSDKKLYGTFTVASTADGYKAEIGSDGTEEVVLSVGETAINLTSGGTTFYIAIPEQTYSYLKIYLSEDGNLYKRAMITKKVDGLGTIECNKIYSIDYETNAVQLYADGPYWATMNLGATTVAGSETCYGDYFAWGETEPYYATKTWTWDGTNYTWTWSFTWKTDKNSGYAWQSYCGQSIFTEWTTKPYDDTSKNLTGTYDAATVNWGAAWKMPTGGQFQALTDNSNPWIDNYNGVDGYKFSGKNDYSGIELFFPFAGWLGDDDTFGSGGEDGLYWSSSLYTDDPCEAYFLYLGSDEAETTDEKRYYGHPVRPVSY